MKAVDYQLGKSKIIFRLGARDFVTKHELSLKLDILNENKQYMPIYVSEFVKNPQNKVLDWKPFYLNANKVTEESQSLKLEVYERRKGKPLKFHGEAEIIFSYLKNNGGKTLKVYKNNFVIGEIKIIEVKEASKFTFVSYLYAGWEVKLMVAIDFTNSNKDSRTKNSLHYCTTEGITVLVVMKGLSK